MSFPRYPKYKDSGVEWLGNVPAHWTVQRLKHLCEVFPSNVDKKSHDGERPVKLCNYTDVYYNDVITADLDFMQATASQDQVAKFTLRAGDTIITKDSETADDIGVAAYVPRDLPGVVCGYHLSVVRPRGPVTGAFIKRAFDSAALKAQMEVSANGLTRVGLDQNSVDNLVLPMPPAAEQTSIAAFIDRETAKIDALINEQQRLIELLTEKRQAVTSHAVTKGLNPKAPLKASGVTGVGDIPAHWTVVTLKTVARVNTGMAKGKELGDCETMEVPYLRVANVQDGYVKLDDVAVMQIPVADLPRYALQRGDVLMNEGGDFDKLGRGCVWDGSIDPCITQNHVFAVRPHGISAEWLNTVTGADYAKFYFMSRSKQSTNLASISSRNLMELPVVVPPDSEVEAILSEISRWAGAIDKLVTEAQRATTLLQERRTALISAAVTGQIDVRAAADKVAA